MACHIDPLGGGPRNEFGLAFADNGMTITPLLRAQFSDRFTYNTAPLGGLTIPHFSDPENAVLLVEVDGQRYSRGSVSPRYRRCPSTGTRCGHAPKACGASEAGRCLYSGRRILRASHREPAQRKGHGTGGVEFLIGHRFTFPVFNSDSPANLFGFDSSAFVTFGVQVGLTDQLCVSAMRSNLDRTIELSSAFQLSRQSGGGPVSPQIRAGVEGRNNFQERFAPFLQFVSTRRFWRPLFPSPLRRALRSTPATKTRFCRLTFFLERNSPTQRRSASVRG